MGISLFGQTMNLSIKEDIEYLMWGGWPYPQMRLNVKQWEQLGKSSVETAVLSPSILFCDSEERRSESENKVSVFEIAQRY